MKRIQHLLKIVMLFALLPFEISKGSKKRIYTKIRKRMVAANIL
jgi:hypothetical protein